MAHVTQRQTASPSSCSGGSCSCCPCSCYTCVCPSSICECGRQGQRCLDCRSGVHFQCTVCGVVVSSDAITAKVVRVVAWATAAAYLALFLFGRVYVEGVHSGIGFIISLEAFNGAARGDKRPLQAFFLYEALAGLYSILVGTALLADQTFECFLRENPTTCNSVQFILGSILISLAVGELSASAVVFLAWLNVRGVADSAKTGSAAQLQPERSADATVEHFGAHTRVPMSGSRAGYDRQRAGGGRL